VHPQRSLTQSALQRSGQSLCAAETEADHCPEVLPDGLLVAQRSQPRGIRGEAAAVGPEREEQHAAVGLETLWSRVVRRRVVAQPGQVGRRPLGVVDVGEGANSLEQPGFP